MMNSTIVASHDCAPVDGVARVVTMYRVEEQLPWSTTNTPKVTWLVTSYGGAPSGFPTKKTAAVYYAKRIRLLERGAVRAAVTP